MKRIEFENLPSKNTPLSAENLNTLQDNIEEAIGEAIKEKEVSITAQTGFTIQGKVHETKKRVYLDLSIKWTGSQGTLSNPITGLPTSKRTHYLPCSLFNSNVTAAAYIHSGGNFTIKFSSSVSNGEVYINGSYSKD